MLPAPNRLTRRDDFATAVRRGRRAARRTLVVHLARSPSPGLPAPEVLAPEVSVREVPDSEALNATGLNATGLNPRVSPRVGFVVGRPVGGAVVRHRVQRQLRHLMRSRLSALPDGTLVVVRALPAAAGAGSAAMSDDLDAALRRLA